MTHPNREGRERAVELLYEADAKGQHPAEVVAALPVSPVPYAASLAEGVGDHLDLVDHLIGSRARGWTVARMPAVDRALLRLGTYELAFEPDQPQGVVISEAVELATSLSTDDSPKFVNGVLGALADDVRGGGAWRNVSCPIALLVDMDGVIRHWNGSDLLAADRALGVPEGTYASIALEPDRVRRANDGTVSDAEWRQEVVDVLVVEHGCDPAVAITAWSTDGFEIDDEVVDLLRRVQAAGAPVVLTSNATSRLEADLEARSIRDAFSAVVNSSTVRSLKPAPEIYLAAADAAGAAPGDCLFVDDRPENIAGALAVGIPAVTFRNAARLARTLARVGLLP